MKDWRAIAEDWPVADPMIAVDRLQSAGTFVRRQTGIHVPRAQMQALMDAQVILLRARMRVLNEAERVWREVSKA